MVFNHCSLSARQSIEKVTKNICKTHEQSKRSQKIKQNSAEDLGLNYSEKQ